MATEYNAEISRKLQKEYEGLGLARPMRVSRYDAGSELIYDVTGVEKPDTARVCLLVERFVGGGFAGQVYKVKVIDIQNATGPIGRIEQGGVYALKIFVPPSGFATLFRNTLYRIGFQAPFQLQVNPAAARAEALWQKFIRRAAGIRFGDESTVVDVHATLIDERIGSCGELSEWVEGRTWRLEVDDRMDLLKLWRRGGAVDTQKLGSPEYRAKKKFMDDFVGLLRDVGAPELARQYEWWTCKSQPNCLKRRDAEGRSAEGLVAVDFKPGLVLLPFLPMSPGDFALIAKGIGRGSIVQFDRGDVSKLEAFTRQHREQFADMHAMLEELKAVEQVYRNSVPDVTCNDLRLLYDRRLWSTILDSAVTGWGVRNLIDDRWERKLRKNVFLTLLFCVLGLIPFLGKFLRRLWARADWRNHYASVLTSWDYLCRAVRGRIMEKTIGWYRAGRVSAPQAMAIVRQPRRFFYHLPLLLLVFPGLHRFFADADFRKEKLVFIFVRPFRLYFNSSLREQWLRDMVGEGKKKHILTDDDAETILSQISEPYVQRYLISLVVHLFTLPITQIVSVTIAAIYYYKTGSTLGAGGILVLFQITPISPGSIARGLYAVGIAIYDRSFKNYNIAVFLSFFKYIGYLAFPIQMTYHYPALARFMASHWATEAVHFVPVFGERGALLEHWVFGLFYNWPLTIRRRMSRRAEIRASLAPRYWHAGPWILAGVVIFAVADVIYFNNAGKLPALTKIWWLVAGVPLLCGAGVTLGCGGASLWKRIVAATISGAMVGILAVGFAIVLGRGAESAGLKLLGRCAMQTFIFAVLSTLGAIIAELRLPDPDLISRA